MHHEVLGNSVVSMLPFISPKLTYNKPIINIIFKLLFEIFIFYYPNYIIIMYMKVSDKEKKARKS
jgi:hypothetical protein